MELLKGAPVSASIKEEAEKKIRNLKRTPLLGVVRVGERPDDLSYERAAVKKMESFGLSCRSFSFPETIGNTEFLQEFDKINKDSGIDGILLLKPLPAQLDWQAADNMIDPDKDVDGISPVNMARVYAGDPDGFSPCTAEAVIRMLKYYKVPIAGKRAVILGRSLVVGRPLSMLMLKENATVTVCHTKTADLNRECLNAQILVAAAGKAKMIGKKDVADGAVVIDVGIHVDENKNMCGDVDFDQVSEKAAFGTPVPGGIGAVTTAVLAEHLIRAYEKKSRL